MPAANYMHTGGSCVGQHLGSTRSRAGVAGIDAEAGFPCVDSATVAILSIKAILSLNMFSNDHKHH